MVTAMLTLGCEINYFEIPEQIMSNISLKGSNTFTPWKEVDSKFRWRRNIFDCGDKEMSLTAFIKI